MAKQTDGRRNGGARKDPTVPRPTDAKGRLSVLIELQGSPGAASTRLRGDDGAMNVPGLVLDEEFAPVPMTSGTQGLRGGPETYLVRGTVADEDEMAALQRRPDVAAVWLDTPIAPFETRAAARARPATRREADAANVEVVEDNPSMAPCPIGTCDCSPGTPKGNMTDVANYLGVNLIWSAGFRGAGIVVGVVDSGMTAVGRPVKAGETTRRIPRVIGGWPTGDWGTESSKWGDHGNMCGTDVLGMAPDAQLYDLRVAGSGGSPGTISRALQAFQWAIDRHRVDGTPHVLTNSWGIFQRTWDTTYASNPNHPFTRKVEEAMNEGILVLFAAGNCGDTCPDGRCGSDTGPGKSIWGANGHPRVMTVGAVNKNEQFVGYSSRGPASLSADKPDFCSITHFTGYFTSDSGTSAATPILAGVVALMKQGKASLTQDACRNALRATAKDIGPGGFDPHSGMGIVRGKAAFDRVRGAILTAVSVDVLETLREHITVAEHVGTPVSLDVRDTVLEHVNTPPAADLGGTGIQDTIQEHVGTLHEHVDDPIRDRVRDRVRVPVGRVGGARPFALATPHHARTWRDLQRQVSDARWLAAEIAAVEASIEERQQYLQDLVETYDALVADDGAAGYGDGDGPAGYDGGYGDGA